MLKLLDMLSEFILTLYNFLDTIIKIPISIGSCFTEMFSFLPSTTSIMINGLMICLFVFAFIRWLTK